jgi:hypothetical protein
MARKPKAKRPGRPNLAKDAVRQVYSVRLPPLLVERVEAHGKLTTVVEQALRDWLDEHSPVNQGDEHA